MNTPKNFAMQLGALVTLYASIASFTSLLFGVITISFPDAADYYYTAENASYTIRFGIATLIVVFPTYLWLTRTVNQIRRNNEGKYLALTKWLIYLSLLVGGGILGGDLIAVINGYLNGELTTRFALKAAVLALVILIAFYYYLKDAQDHWRTNEKTSRYFANGAMIMVVIALTLGFMNSDTPLEVREMKIDDRQVTDLQNIQMRVEEYYRIENSLPESAEVLYVGETMPESPEDREAYTYALTGDNTYELCAFFAHESQESDRYQTIALPVKTDYYTWDHGTGHWCFKRAVEDRTVVE